jgi:hypothetical protein
LPEIFGSESRSAGETDAKFSAWQGRFFSLFYVKGRGDMRSFLRGLVRVKVWEEFHGHFVELFPRTLP